MDTIAFQVTGMRRQSRALKVKAVGDFAKNEIKPRILLAGAWLERAGFKPGHRVQIVIEQHGILSLRFVEQFKEVVL